MKILNKVAYAGIAAGLIGALWFLYAKTQSADFAAQNQVAVDLRELVALDAEWTVDSLRAKTGINRQFEPGNAPDQRVARAAGKLSGDIDAIGAAEAVSKFAEVKAVFAKKTEVTRRFTQQNAILRSALVFVADESADLLALLRVHQREVFAQKSVKDKKSLEFVSELGVRINELLTETLKYNLLTDAMALKRIESNLNGLAALSPEYPDFLAEPLKALTAQFLEVQRQKAIEDSLLNEIAALPTQARIA